MTSSWGVSLRRLPALLLSSRRRRNLNACSARPAYSRRHASLISRCILGSLAHFTGLCSQPGRHAQAQQQLGTGTSTATSCSALATEPRAVWLISHAGRDGAKSLDSDRYKRLFKACTGHKQNLIHDYIARGLSLARACTSKSTDALLP